MTYHRVDPQPKVSGTTRPGNRVLDWQPVQPVLTHFMSSRTTCTVCKWARKSAGLPRDTRLHVRIADKMLTATEIDDLHVPGRRLIAVHCLSFGTFHLFKLTGSRIDDGKVLSAAGVATLGWLRGRRRLKILGVAEGFTSHGDVLFDAVEDVD